MIEYIYFVKCPNCEDEPFYFFNEAKEFAMNCISQKPIITQVEVDRNDFGECVDSSDLGTVWSWEETMKDVAADPEATVFSKADTFGTKCDCGGKCGDHCKCGKHGHEEDPEFAALDNSLDAVPDNYRKPIPDGMTIHDLVEAMEENEDTVECVGCEELFPKDECFHKEGIGWLCGDCEDTIVRCTWCEELYDKSECRKEVDMGWLCDRCQAAIMSRGETLTFREGSYWDFLDEKLDIDFSNCIDSSDMEIWGVEQTKPNIYKAVLLKRFDQVDFHDWDATQAVHDEMLQLDGLFTFYFDKDGKPALNSWNVRALNDLGRCEIIFEDSNYDTALEAHFSRVSDAAKNSDHDPLDHHDPDYDEDEAADYTADRIDAAKDDLYDRSLDTLEEAAPKQEMVEFEYEKLTITVDGPMRDADDWDEIEYTDSYTLSKCKSDVEEDLYLNYITDEDVAAAGGDVERFGDDSDYGYAFIAEHFDTFFEKYYTNLKDDYEEEALEAFRDETSYDDVQNNYYAMEADRRYDEWRDERYFGEDCEKKTKSVLEELEETDVVKSRLIDCPECGTVSYDPAGQYCTNCGLNL